MVALPAFCGGSALPLPARTGEPAAAIDDALKPRRGCSKPKAARTLREWRVADLIALPGRCELRGVPNRDLRSLQCDRILRTITRPSAVLLTMPCCASPSRMEGLEEQTYLHRQAI